MTTTKSTITNTKCHQSHDNIYKITKGVKRLTHRLATHKEVHSCNLCYFYAQILRQPKTKYNKSINSSIKEIFILLEVEGYRGTSIAPAPFLSCGCGGLNRRPTYT